jgi:hypothetical protein
MFISNFAFKPVIAAPKVAEQFVIFKPSACRVDDMI